MAPMTIKRERDDSEHGNIKIDMPAGQQALHPILVISTGPVQYYDYSPRPRKPRVSDQTCTRYSARSRIEQAYSR
jgi:hypothetical protein